MNQVRGWRTGKITGGAESRESGNAGVSSGLAGDLLDGRTPALLQGIEFPSYPHHLGMFTFHCLAFTIVIFGGIDREEQVVAPLSATHQQTQGAGLAMQGLRTDNYQGYINVKVEPSRRVRPGIYVQVNDHFEARDYNASQGADQMVDTLISVWSESLTRALNISQSLMGPQ